MPKRTIILILILTVLTVLLVVLAIRNERQMVTETTHDQAPVVVQELEKTATLSFSPETVIVASTGATTTVDMIIDTKDYSIDGVQIELLYDPTILRNVRIVTPEQNFFGGVGDSNNLLNEVDVERGRVSYWLGINPTLTSRTGTGTVAQLSFTVNPASTETETVIEVLERSMITENESHSNVLATPSPLTISIVR